MPPSSSSTSSKSGKRPNRVNTLGRLEVSKNEGFKPSYVLSWIPPDHPTTSSSGAGSSTTKTPNIVIMNEDDVVSSFIDDELRRFNNRQSNSGSGDRVSTETSQNKLHPFIIPSVASTQGYDLYARDESECIGLMEAVATMLSDEEEEGHTTGGVESETPILSELGSVHYIDDVLVFTPERNGKRKIKKWEPGMLIVFNDEAMAYVEGIVNSGELDTGESRDAADLRTMYEHWVRKFVLYVGES